MAPPCCYNHSRKDLQFLLNDLRSPNWQNPNLHDFYLQEGDSIEHPSLRQ